MISCGRLIFLEKKEVNFVLLMYITYSIPLFVHFLLFKLFKYDSVEVIKLKFTYFFWLGMIPFCV